MISWNFCNLCVPWIWNIQKSVEIGANSKVIFKNFVFLCPPEEKFINGIESMGTFSTLHIELMVFHHFIETRHAKNTKWKFYCVDILFKWLNDFGQTILTCNHFTNITVITHGRAHRLDKCLFSWQGLNIYYTTFAWRIRICPIAKQAKTFCHLFHFFCPYSSHSLFSVRAS